MVILWNTQKSSVSNVFCVIRTNEEISATLGVVHLLHGIT